MAWQVHQRVAAWRGQEIGKTGGWQYAKITGFDGDAVIVKFERDGEVQTVSSEDIKLRNE